MHEWAHVQRRDDYARLAQVVIRMVAGLHPAVWWIGRRLEIEREIACDDYAVNITGAAQRLARCLTKLAEAPQRAMRAALAPGMLASSQLTLRVRSLLDPRRNTSTAGARATLGSLPPRAGGPCRRAVAPRARRGGIAAGRADAARLPPSPLRRRCLNRQSPMRRSRVAPPARDATVNGRRSGRGAARNGSPGRRHSGRDAAGRQRRGIAPVAAGTAAHRQRCLARSCTTRSACRGRRYRRATGPRQRPRRARPRALTKPRGARLPMPASRSVEDRRRPQPRPLTPARRSGRGTQKAAVATAGFFTRLGRKIAGRF